MANQPLYKILVPLDGSKRSEETMDYICEHFGFLDAQFVLFHVFNAIPECYWDLAKEPKSVRVTPAVRAWQNEQKKMMDAYMEKCAEKLHLGGVDRSRITIRVKNRSEGVARDIAAEAHKRYDAVLIRRRGMSLLPELIVGSVAAKLIQSLAFVPVIVAGRRPCTGKILLAFDGSEDAMRAVRFVGNFLKGTDSHITLFYALRGVSTGSDGYLFSPEECIEAARSAIHDYFDAAIDSLKQSGIDGGAIDTRIVENISSRAEAICREAENGDYGTIVVGRRGMSRVKDFFIGRVSSKVINGARSHAIWVVT